MSSMIESESFISSNINKGMYNKIENNLYIQFHGKDRIYMYEGVEEELWKQFRNAESAGGFFHKFIADEYPYQELTSLPNR